MVISPATRARIDAEIAKYPRPRGALLPALHLVQAELGWVSLETARELAAIFELAPVEVMEVVTFYNLFYDCPQGRHHVHVCTNLSCSLRGGRRLLRELERHLGIEAGQTTRDGRVTLEHEECLGACGYAPMLRIDGVYHEELDLEAARRLVDALE
jgi:NADH-quinone oxidoreductase E subunit